MSEARPWYAYNDDGLCDRCRQPAVEPMLVGYPLLEHKGTTATICMKCVTADEWQRFEAAHKDAPLGLRRHVSETLQRAAKYR